MSIKTKLFKGVAMAVLFSPQIAYAVNQDYYFHFPSPGTVLITTENFKNDYDNFAVVNTKYNDLVQTDNVQYRVVKNTIFGTQRSTSSYQVFGNYSMSLTYLDGTTYGDYRRLEAQSYTHYATISGTWAP
ncbi:hypothetical protein [Fundicoccus culcitae]|uniref:Uncharacterized protein n=1 Tax=Fundicoccus culcitae TaxID=2969821 RepID=A0ABY5P994_9LACT|nr:hypothetical protein [Fundicoccus culcitae]UUX34933.1 hypothetical protein NRE15_04615 [Fundicoccus culcitae]